MATRRNIELGLLASLLCTLLISFAVIIRSPATCPPQESVDGSNDQGESDVLPGGTHRLAVIVPFRDRFDELLQFVPYMHKFLGAQQIRHRFLIVNQVDRLRFNRGSLINVGFLVAEPDCDYLVMHDVDLLPLNRALSYAYPANGGPMHLAAPDLHPRYHYPTFVGGILLMSSVRFRQLNGLSNKYWGWGLEDDEFYARMRDAGLNVTRPSGLKTGVRNTFRHIHDKQHRPRDTARLHNQRAETRRRDRVTGLADVKYDLVSRRRLVIDGAPAEVLDVRLRCNLTATPWCQK